MGTFGYMKYSDQQHGPSQNKIGVRRDTKEKFERVARARRWTMVETADAVVDAYIEREGIERRDTQDTAPTSSQAG